MCGIQRIIKVAVIGAGAAGLCAGRHLASDHENFEFDIYEQLENIGGTWRFSEKVGINEYGLPVHSSLYKNLRTNLPKEIMAFPDFPFEDCGGRSFIHHSEVLYYLEQYVRYFGVYKYIKFLHLVESVEPQKNSIGKTEWIVGVRDLRSGHKFTKIYDAVFVCNGRYSVPYIPDIPGLNSFQGILIHSHDYRDSSRFADKKVVILGAGVSGLDIALEVSKVAKEVILSHNNKPETWAFPSNMHQEKGISAVHNSGVTFNDGKTYDCEAIIICTGYLYTYPFLHSKCGVEIEDQRVKPLYLHLFLINDPTLTIWSVPNVTFQITDQQVKVFLKFLKGIIQLPSKECMLKDAEDDFLHRIQLGLKSRHAHLMYGELPWEYDDKLSKLGDIPPIPESVRNLYRYVYKTREEDIVHYRDRNYRIVDDKCFEELN